MKWDPPRRNANTGPNTMLLFLEIRGGMVAASPRQTCTTQKMIIKTPKMTSREIIRPSDQLYFDAPHCNVRRKQTIPGMNTHVPIGSTWEGNVRQVCRTSDEESTTEATPNIDNRSPLSVMTFKSAVYLQNVPLLRYSYMSVACLVIPSTE